jgi:hypothetical protein
MVMINNQPNIPSSSTISTSHSSTLTHLHQSPLARQAKLDAHMSLFDLHGKEYVLTHRKKSFKIPQEWSGEIQM